jgi:hypothetical protein
MSGEVTAGVIYDVLVREAGASDTESMRAQFARWFANREELREFRFMGELGFGGKLWWTGRPRHFAISYYPEHRSADRDAIVERASAALGELVA